jgi:hypothetical protein
VFIRGGLPCLFSHALYEQDQLTVPRVAAARIARLQVSEPEAVPPALLRAQQPDMRGVRFRFGEQVAQSPGEYRDGTAATVLEDQQVDVRMGDHGLQAEQTQVRIQDETVPR